jgi:rhomboid protease GluP
MGFNTSYSAAVWFDLLGLGLCSVKVIAGFLFMDTFIIKLKHILPAYFIVVFSTLIFALSFRWFFSIHTDILSIREEYYHIWIPFILPWIPITLWLRQKLRILKFKKPTGDSSAHQFIVWLTMTAMLIISNHYLTEKTSEFEALSRIEDLKNARYISLENINLDKKYLGVHTEFSSSGKYNQHFNFDIYLVYPFKSDNVFKYWYGKKYHRHVSNKLNNFEKKQRFRSFYRTALRSFEVFNETNYFEVLPDSEDRDGFIEAVNKVEIYTDEIIVVKPKTNEFSQDHSKSFFWIFGAFGIGFSIFLVALIFPGYNKKEHQRQLKGLKPKSDDLVDMIKFLIPRNDHYITSILINLNLIVFIIMIISGVSILSPKGIELLEFGGNRRTETLNGEWWRLITNIFIHGGVMHLFLNIFGLVIGSFFIEPIFSRLQYVLIYLLSGISASLCSIYWYENTISVGASGAIFGLYGALFGLMLTNDMSSEYKKSMFMILGPYVGISLIAGLTGGIDNAAHFGGLISGVIISIVIYIVNGKSVKNRL